MPGLRCAAEVGSSGSGIEPWYPALGHQGSTWIDELEIFFILFLHFIYGYYKILAIFPVLCNTSL